MIYNSGGNLVQSRHYSASAYYFEPVKKKDRVV